MDSKTIKEQAKGYRKENWGVLLLSDALVALVAAIPLIGIIALPPVMLGAYENFYNTMENKPTGWQKLYGKFKDSFESSFLFCILFGLAAVVVTAVFVLALIIVNAILTAIIRSFVFATIMTVLIVILVIVFVIVLVPVLCMYEFIGFQLMIKDPEMKGDAAFKKAREIGKGHEADSIGLMLSYILEILLSLITCGLYLVVFAPEFSMAYTIYANNLIGAAKVTQSPLAPAASGKICPNCKTVNEDDALFCEKCGNKLA